MLGILIFTFTLEGIKIECLKQFLFCLILFLFCLGEHENCKKFQFFLLKEFSRLFKMYVEMSKKETATSEKLLRALERCDELDYEVQKLRNELSEYHFYEFDL
jgi:hypothetical protein